MRVTTGTSEKSERGFLRLRHQSGAGIALQALNELYMISSIMRCQSVLLEILRKGISTHTLQQNFALGGSDFFSRVSQESIGLIPKCRRNFREHLHLGHLSLQWWSSRIRDIYRVHMRPMRTYCASHYRYGNFAVYTPRKQVNESDTHMSRA